MKKSRIPYFAVAVVVVAAVAWRGATLHRDYDGRSQDRIAVQTGIAYAASRTSPEKSKPPVKTSPAEAAIKAAASQNRYVLVVFRAGNDAAGKKAEAVVRSFQAKHASRASFISVDATNAINKGLVDRYGIDRTSLPLTLAIAPNGAATGGFPREVKPEALSGVFVSNGMAKVLRVLQDRKLAAVCLQNSRTKHNQESLAAAEGLVSDPKLSGVVAVVKIDPASAAEATFMQKCKVDPQSTIAQVVLIVPPGQIVGKFDGAVTKAELMDGLQKALSSCGSGCAPSGCGP